MGHLGIGLMLGSLAHKALHRVHHHTDRILVAEFSGNPVMIVMTVYSPTNVSPSEEVDTNSGPKCPSAQLLRYPGWLQCKDWRIPQCPSHGTWSWQWTLWSVKELVRGGPSKTEPQVFYVSWTTYEWGKSGETPSWTLSHTACSALWAGQRFSQLQPTENFLLTTRHFPSTQLPLAGGFFSSFLGPPV